MRISRSASSYWLVAFLFLLLLSIPVAARRASLARLLVIDSPREEPRALTPRGLDNLVAFTRLVGYVRFFHPSDAVLTTNWDEFTVRGVRLVEQAPTADSLAATLSALFAPIAPTVAVSQTGALSPQIPSAPAKIADLGIVFWEHCGYGVPEGTRVRTSNSDYYVYYSVRRRVAAPAGAAPDSTPVVRCGPQRKMEVPDPSRPFAAELGGGVSASVPLALFTRATDVDSLWRPRAARESFSLDDRATRLADVALLWMVPQHFYPYFDVVGTDWTAALRRALVEAATDQGSAPFDTTLQRLVAALRDGHGNVYRRGVGWAAPDVGFGWVENRVVVTAVGDSAAAAGVRRGDELVAVDGRPVADALRDAEELVSGATQQWIRQKALIRLALGAPRTLTVLRLRDPIDPGASPRDVRVMRAGAPPQARANQPKISELRQGSCM